MKTKNAEFQKSLVDKLRNKELSYEDASIYTVILDLCLGNGIDEVKSILEMVAKDILTEAK